MIQVPREITEVPGELAEISARLADFAAAQTVLAAMIAPAVLIAACSSLIVATSSRLGRVIDRVRDVSGQFERIARDPGETALLEEQRALLFGQIARATRRTRLLQRSMVRFYAALSIFILMMLGIGVEAATEVSYAWTLVLLGFAGAALLLWGSVLLIIESRVALAMIDDEMDVVRRLGRHVAPPELREK